MRMAPLLYMILRIEKSFEKTEEWIQNLHSSVDSDHVVKIIVGNKADKVPARKVSAEEGRSLAEKLDTRFAECSAETGSNVDSIINLMF